MMVDQPKYKTSDEVDFVIIGSGAAAESSPRNFRPTAFAWLFLEQGPYLTEADFTHNEVEILAQDKLTNHPKPSQTPSAKRPAKKPSRSVPSFMAAA